MRHLALLVMLLPACSPDSTTSPDSYVFTGRTADDSVSYSGQVFRNLLIHDLKQHLGDVTDRVDNGWFPEPGDVTAEAAFYLAFDGDTSGDIAHGLRADLPLLQTSYSQVAAGKDLLGKLAGNDPIGQHKDWSNELQGWSDDKVTSPESLINSWVAAIDEAAVRRANGDIDLDPSGAPVPSVLVSAAGLDHKQLIEKFLRGAISFSQGADDYLDDDVPDKGLNSDHSALVDGKPYTELEHAWDEGFGYFGAARAYGTLDDDAIADEFNDTNADGSIDMQSEVNFGHSVNAAKRDRDSDPATDFTDQAWRGFAAGRQLLDDTDGALTVEQLTELKAHRDGAVQAWEKAVSASVVHYINEVLVDMKRVGTDEYSFADHAKHWSEMKGFALTLQFNPHSPMSDADFAAMHTLIAHRPALSDADQATRDGYAEDLRSAREILGETYGFDVNNLGGEHGEDGW